MSTDHHFNRPKINQIQQSISLAMDSHIDVLD